MTTRISGLSSGMDIDSLVTAAMMAQRSKIDKVQQKSDLETIKQKLYRETIKEVRTFYDKYFDPSNKNSLLLSKNFKDIYDSNANTTSNVSGGLSSDKSDVVTSLGVSSSNSSYKVQVYKIAEPAKCNIDKVDLQNSISIDINYDGITKSINLSNCSDEEAVANEITNNFKEYGISAKFNSDSGQLELVTNKPGIHSDTSKNFSVTIKGLTTENTLISSDAKNAEVKIIGSNGSVVEYTGENSLADNSLTFDGVTFNLTGEGIAIVKTSDNSSNSASNKLEDKIEEFIKDYNTLITSLNTKIQTKHDSDYVPLTKDQKDEMSEDEITKWNNKLEEGQLYRDMYLNQIVSGLKSAVSASVEGSSIKLTDIGITLNKEYGVKSGTLSFDKDKFINSLEYNFDDVKKIFTSVCTDDDASSDKKYSQNGVFMRMKNLIFDNVYTSTSSLLKKVGYEGTATYSNNTISKNIANYKIKISELETAFTKKEDNLYAKYAKMESALSSLTSQTSYLTQLFGGSSS